MKFNHFVGSTLEYLTVSLLVILLIATVFLSLR